MSSPDQAQTSSKGLLAPPFIALLTTEILSNLGQTCLVFALPLHLLNISGSASLYGMASAMAVLPSILLTPLGGALADRLHKQSTMAVLDILSALTAFLYILISHKIDPVFLTVTCMMLVNAYRACYSPTVQAALHCLVDSPAHRPWFPRRSPWWEWSDRCRPAWSWDSSESCKWSGLPPWPAFCRLPGSGSPSELPNQHKATSKAQKHW